jgi:hypothetical protein
MYCNAVLQCSLEEAAGSGAPPQAAAHQTHPGLTIHLDAIHCGGRQVGVHGCIQSRGVVCNPDSCTAQPGSKHRNALAACTTWLGSPRAAMLVALQHSAWQHAHIALPCACVWPTGHAALSAADHESPSSQPEQQLSTSKALRNSLWSLPGAARAFAAICCPIQYRFSSSELSFSRFFTPLEYDSACGCCSQACYCYALCCLWTTPTLPLITSCAQNVTSPTSSSDHLSSPASTAGLHSRLGSTSAMLLVGLGNTNCAPVTPASEGDPGMIPPQYAGRPCQQYTCRTPNLAQQYSSTAVRVSHPMFGKYNMLG